MSFTLLGTGSRLPETVITNDELSTFLDTSDEWIRTRTGIQRRHLLKEEKLIDIAVPAAQQALENSGVKAEELDLIICSTLQGDFVSPAFACLVQKYLGAHCPAFDINAACSGFVYALDVAAGYFARKRVKKVLIIAAEAMSRFMDWNDRGTCVLFGDGCGAVVLGEGDDLLSIQLTAQGNDEALAIPHEKGSCPYTRREGKPSVLSMDGQEVFKFAVSSICRDIAVVTQEAGITPQELDFMVLHQANYRIMEAAARRLKIPMEKVPTIIAETGNVSSACIPMVLDELNRSGKLVNSRYIALAGFGAGFTTGACVLRCHKK